MSAGVARLPKREEVNLQLLPSFHKAVLGVVAQHRVVAPSLLRAQLQAVGGEIGDIAGSMGDLELGRAAAGTPGVRVLRGVLVLAHTG